MIFWLCYETWVYQCLIKQVKNPSLCSHTPNSVQIPQSGRTGNSGHDKQPSETVLYYKTFFYTGLQPNETISVIRYAMHQKHKLNSLKGKMIRKYCKCMNSVLNDLLHMKVHSWNDQ